VLRRSCDKSLRPHLHFSAAGSCVEQSLDTVPELGGVVLPTFDAGFATSKRRGGDPRIPDLLDRWRAADSQRQGTVRRLDLSTSRAKRVCTRGYE
jgi:hypothetical protein